MNSPNSEDNEFLAKLTEIIEANLTNSQFGVSMLAKELGMSRSNLHRKVNELTKITVSQFINHVRLKKAKEILRHTSNTVSEVAYEVGFSNVSYFIKCFHEYYGYSPGEVGNRENEDIQAIKGLKIKPGYFIGLIIVLVSVISVLVYLNSREKNNLKKTIAILPTYYETRDTNYLPEINGTVQNVIDNLNLIKDIDRVAPWVSVLQYKNSTKPAPEIAKELNVEYVVKPSILSNNGNIQLKIRIIEGVKDKQIWTYSYEIDINNVTSLYQKISKEIAKEINAQITPAEQAKIEKPITSNGKALNYYNVGIDCINLWRLNSGNDNLDCAITNFEKALEYDNECASAYAQLATIYYYKDQIGPDAKFSISGDEKTFSKQINKYADKALFYDDELDLSLLAKALYYQNEEEFEIAVTYLEKALEYNPKSILAIRTMCWIYYQDLRDLEKSLKYALLAMKLKIPVSDTTFYSEDLATNYYYLATTFRALGFFDQALLYIDESLEIKPNNINAKISRNEILIDKDNDYEGAKESYLNLIKLDTTNNLELKRLLAVSCYKMRDWESALKYYQDLLKTIDAQNLDYSGLASGRLAVVYSKLGDTEKEREHINKYFDLVKNREIRTYSDYGGVIAAYSLVGESEKAIEQLKVLSQLKTNYAIIRNLKDDPGLDNMREIPEFNTLISEMESRFWENHDRIKKELEKEGLLNLNI